MIKILKINELGSSKMLVFEITFFEVVELTSSVYFFLHFSKISTITMVLDDYEEN